ncbi:sel1 repeat family protein [Phenylobacterium sp. 20VBR1]|uniref:Sel1 repeat family protein n=1 Tax=Phenylobacterium glaciei TaxID=2803784 RepID=A0A941D5L7_9CAUL|nr:tetratricopeptide repeat protein [Phenylobacterium glaciei]MBR7621371.1 sel1 repeat family protein [Phenylobacterium glaciei]
MLRLTKVFITAAVLALRLCGVAWAGPAEDADDAFARGDYMTALQLVRPLADQGNAVAQYHLGLLYDTGQGVPQDYAAAAAWYRKAADQGHSDAQFNLGLLYDNGQGAPQDHAAAAAWYRKAADQGDAEAQTNLGIAYATGQGVAQDYVLARMWLNLAAAQGDTSAGKARDVITTSMTPAEIAEAQRLASAWKPTRP